MGVRKEQGRVTSVRRRRRRQPRLFGGGGVSVRVSFAFAAAATVAAALGAAPASALGGGVFSIEERTVVAETMTETEITTIAEEGNDDDKQEEGGSPTSCRILALFPLSSNDFASSQYATDGDFLLRSALLAVRHFNDRDPVVVPELAAPEFAIDAPSTDNFTVDEYLRYNDSDDDAGGCPVRLSLSAFDSRQYYEGDANGGLGGGGIEGAISSLATSSSSSSAHDDERSETQLCALLGGPSYLPLPPVASDPENNETTEAEPSMSAHDASHSLSSLAAALGVTRVLHSGSSSSSFASFSSSTSYRNKYAAVSLDAPPSSYGAAAVSYLARPGLDRRFVTVLYDGTDSIGVGIKKGAAREAWELEVAAAATDEAGREDEGRIVNDGGIDQGGLISGLRAVAYFPSPSTENMPMGTSEEDTEETQTLLDADTIRSIRRALTDVSMIGYRTIILVPSLSSDPSLFLPIIASEAETAGLLDGERLWIVPDASGSVSEYIRASAERTGSALDRLLRGMAVVRTSDWFEAVAGDDVERSEEKEEGGGGDRDGNDNNNSDHDDSSGGGSKFLEAWPSVTSSALLLSAEEALGQGRGVSGGGAGGTHEMAPHITVDDVPPPPPLPPPPARASFVYDSIVALGMGLCRHRGWSGSGSGSTRETSLAEAIRTLAFQGASGGVSFDSRTGERSKDGPVFGVYNVRRAVETDEGSGGDGEVSYHPVLTFTRTSAGVWSEVAGEHFLYASGSRFPPHLVRDDQSPNFLSPSVHNAGLSLMSVSLAISAGSALWVYANRRTRIVRSAQPQFLYLLCFGSMLSASSIAFTSYDESYGWSEDKLSAACVAFPWLFTMGYIIIYASLYMKLLRIHCVLQFRKNRQGVPLRQIAWPFVILLLLAAAALTVWTVVDPFTWVRETVTEIPPRTCGMCMSENIWAYVVPLAFIITVATVLTAYIAWKARDIPCEFQESSWIYYGVFAHLQSWIVAVPVLVIVQPAHSSADATYLGRTMIMFTFSASMVILIIWPKIFVVLRKRIYGDNVGKRTSRSNLSLGKGAVNISGLTNVSPDSHRADAVPTSGHGPLNSSATRSLMTYKAQERFSDEIVSSDHADDAHELEASSSHGRKSVRFHGDSLKESGHLIVSLETANNRLQQDLEQSVKTLVQKETELEEATQRILFLEQNAREKGEALRSIQERLRLMESETGQDYKSELTNCVEEGR
eukprot:CAMPEP_0197444824 /NCGR_PEP_ID=MMETSP1175-20131217/10194_1 /TAXON_ID=1003142 /ORGANISM="Triceratium dubium, Strain CCMP147" /LENGTH=1207 /DNA_ID=CAMNT_0042975677 /DNA_START=307 /DNA_END=3930 /DNA_ORIENTATION=+